MGRGQYLEMETKAPAQYIEREAEPILRDHTFYMERAIRCMYEGKYESALRYYSRALSQSLQLEDAWTGQCLALLDLGEYEEAEAWAARALDHCPGSAPAFAIRGAALARMGMVERSYAFLDRAARANRAHWLVWISRAEILVVEEKAKNARLCVEKAIELGGAPPWWMMRRAGEMLLLYDHPGAALTYFSKAQGIEPGYAANHLRAAQALCVLGKKKEALICVSRALDIDPAMQDALNLQDDIRAMGLIKRIWSLRLNFSREA
jgi:tetratricopeptide (TPR) repeat protein